MRNQYEVPIDVEYIYTALAMSDTKIRFVFNETTLFSYDIGSGSASIVHGLFSEPIFHIDALDDIWLYEGTNLYTEYQNGNVTVFTNPDQIVSSRLRRFADLQTL